MGNGRLVLMAGYQPLYVKGYETGLIQERQNFILPNDAFPVLENAYVWRERIKRKQGYKLLGRLQRNLIVGDSGAYSTIIGTNTFNIFARIGISLVTEPNASIVPGNISSITIIINGGIGQVLFDGTGNGTMIIIGPGPITSATINYSTGIVSITSNAAAGPVGTAFVGSYYPNLPVMGLPTRELDNLNNEELVAFDTIYAYRYNNGIQSFEEFLPGTVWNGTDYNFFWGTNYWVGNGNLKIFWVTNFSGPLGTPIRYTNGVVGTNWINFTPQINAAGNVLAQSLAILPFRGRLMVFNTWEGPNLAGSQQFPQRIRWAAIGNPFTVASAIVTPVNVNAWRDDIRGQGGFLDIPTSESITSVGFVRDNLVIYCERSTWQLRYTGRSISPFQIEKVNSELGSESTFSAVQFDTSLVGIGDKGIVECDSFKSNLIDVKIPDLVFHFNNDANGVKRVHGIRNFVKRLAYWIYPYNSDNEFSAIYPNRRLIYNYENDSWAIFTDSLTALGTFQPNSGLRWVDVNKPWQDMNVPWIDQPSLIPSIVGGNQQGFIEYLDQQVSSDVSLYIKNITGFGLAAPTRIESPNHNLQEGQVIKIKDIPTGTPFDNLNDKIFSVDVIDSANFDLYLYNAANGQFDIPQNDNPATFVGYGQITVRDNFSVVSKKFNFLDDGQNIQLGYIDVLMDNTTAGEVSLYVYNDYNDSEPVNTYPLNEIPGTMSPDTFFNTVVPTSVSVQRSSTKNWQRVFCPSRAAFITIEWTLSNLQMIGAPQESDVQIDAQILWTRRAGRQLPIGV